jgi:hypothetical protein
MKSFAYAALSLSLLAPQQLFCKTQEKKASLVTNSTKKLGVFAAVSLVVGAAAWKLSQSDKVQHVTLADEADSDGEHSGVGHIHRAETPESVDLENGDWTTHVSSPRAPDTEEQEISPDHEALQPQHEAAGQSSDHDADDESSDTGSVKNAEKTEGEKGQGGEPVSDDEGLFGSLFDQF